MDLILTLILFIKPITKFLIYVGLCAALGTALFFGTIILFPSQAIEEFSTLFSYTTAIALVGAVIEYVLWFKEKIRFFVLFLMLLQGMIITFTYFHLSELLDKETSILNNFGSFFCWQQIPVSAGIILVFFVGYKLHFYFKELR